MNDDDAEKRRWQIADNIAKALGKAGAVVKIEGGKVLAFKRPDSSYGAESIKALEDLDVQPRITRNAIRCRKCDTIIESTHHHDFRECSCGAVFVDGGNSYQRIGGEPADYENLSEYRDA